MECQANDIRFFLLPRIRKKRRFQIPPLPVSRDVFAAVRRYPRLFMAVVAHFILAHIVAYLHGAHTVFHACFFHLRGKQFLYFHAILHMLNLQRRGSSIRCVQYNGPVSYTHLTLPTKA